MNQKNTVFISGFVIFLIASILFSKNFSRVLFKKFTSGKIVQINQNTTYVRNGFLVHPIVEFFDSEGKKNDFEGDMITGGILYNQRGTGNNISIYYDPKNPQDASVFDFNLMFGGFIILGFFGISLMILGQKLKPN